MAENVSRPPLGGPGSGRVAWTRYAEHLGLEVEDGVKLNDIVAACLEAEEEMRAEASANPNVFDENDPYAFIQHAPGTEFVTYDGNREYAVDPITGFATKRISG